jgi:hypothetical protein
LQIVSIQADIEASAIPALNEQDFKETEKEEIE